MCVIVLKGKRYYLVHSFRWYPCGIQTLQGRCIHLFHWLWSLSLLHKHSARVRPLLILALGNMADIRRWHWKHNQGDRYILLILCGCNPCQVDIQLLNKENMSRVLNLKEIYFNLLSHPDEYPFPKKILKIEKGWLIGAARRKL